MATEVKLTKALPDEHTVLLYGCSAGAGNDQDKMINIYGKLLRAAPKHTHLRGFYAAFVA
jgi:hypothetical protein